MKIFTFKANISEKILALIYSFLFLSHTAFGQHLDAAIFLEVSVKEQILYVYQGESLLKSYPISTSKYGEGSQKNSNKTPLGKHRIEQKIGDGAALGTIFKSRKNTHRKAVIYTDPTIDVGEDLVTTRILWLKGLERGKNLGGEVDSFERYIYIHGTNEEGLIGKKSSHGCIRMKNQDVITLFDLVSRGDIVYIKN